MFILFTNSGLNTSLGGKYTELGIVLERNRWNFFYHNAPVKIYLVGSPTNVYTYLIPRPFKNSVEDPLNFGSSP